MTTLEMARAADAIDDPLEAIAGYEAALSDGDQELDVYLDLAAVYLNCLDFGYADAHKLAESTSRAAYSRARTVLLEASKRWPQNPTLSFWLKYLDYVALGAEPFTQMAHALLLEGVREAAGFLYAVTRGVQEGDRARLLLIEVGPGTTSRQRRWRSILTSRSLPPLIT